MTDISTGLFDGLTLDSEGEKVSLWKVLKPFQIMSLLDMIEFDVFQFVRHSDTLLALQREVEKHKGESLNPQEQQVFAAKMQEIRNFLPSFEIDVGRCFERIEIKLFHPEKAKPKLSAMILELRNRINDELQKRLFMFMPAKEAEYYQHYALFGQDVALKFPGANKEITEAGNCYATGNYTACVFHLMRAAEHGARALVGALKIKVGKGTGELPYPVELCEWGQVVKALNEAIALIPNKRKSLTVSIQAGFFSEAVAHFAPLKDAWRNPLSHARFAPGEYDEYKAMSVIVNTRHFMEHLASGRLKELKRRAK